MNLHNGLDIEVHRGSANLPVVIFIHGLGMSRLFWTNPPQANIAGGLFTLKHLLKKHSDSDTSFHDLKALGYSVITWSQSRPVGPIQAASDELIQVIEIASHIPSTGLILIGHSRGGLIAYETIGRHSIYTNHKLHLNITGAKELPLVALITICSPFKGSALARWASHLGGIAQILNSAFPKEAQWKLTRSIKRMLMFLKSKGVLEVLPGSEYLRSLPPLPPDGLKCFSFGGTNPNILTLPTGINIPGSLIHLLPEASSPEELTQEMGDCLVSSKSAVMPGATSHENFPVNHVTCAVNKNIRKRILEIIEE